jgi:hypothetical protein
MDEEFENAVLALHLVCVHTLVGTKEGVCVWGGGAMLKMTSFSQLSAETNRIHLVLFGLQNRTFGPYLTAIPPGRGCANAQTNPGAGASQGRPEAAFVEGASPCSSHATHPGTRRRRGGGQTAPWRSPTNPVEARRNLAKLDKICQTPTRSDNTWRN